jgi:hypothetical protein
VTQDTKVFSGGLLQLGGGTLSTTEISFPVSGAETPGTFDWTSGTLHVGVFHGNLTVPNGGVLAPGNSPGITSVVGNYAQRDGGTLQIEIAGTTRGSQYDAIDVTGSATIDGTLQVSFINGFSPTSDCLFEIIHANLGIFGGFTFSLPQTPAGAWAFVDTGVRFFLLFSPARLPGDFDSDGDVDGADFVAWQSHFPTASGATLTDGDADRDGDVDGADFVVWQTHFPSPPGPGASLIPEPASMFLAAIAAFGLMLFGRRLV